MEFPTICMLVVRLLKKNTNRDEVYQCSTSGNVSFWLEFVWVFSPFCAVSEQSPFVLLQRVARLVQEDRAGLCCFTAKRG